MLHELPVRTVVLSDGTLARFGTYSLTCFDLLGFNVTSADVVGNEYEKLYKRLSSELHATP